MLGTSEGLLSYLEDEDETFRTHGLTELNKIVQNEWATIADKLHIIKQLADDDHFSGREIAASLASRTLYYTGNLTESVKYALKGSNCFDVHNTDAYSRTLISQAILMYSKDVSMHKEPLPELTSMIHKTLDDLLEEKRYEEVLALGIECRSLDHVNSALKGNPELVSRAIRITNRTVDDIDFRESLLKLFVDFATNNCDKLILSQILLALDDPDSTANLIISLKESPSTDNWLLAYQIAFEMADDASQKFRSNIISRLPEEMSDIKGILTRNKLLRLYVKFFYANQSTKLIETIQGIRDSIDSDLSLIHESAVLAYALTFAWTGDDRYYRENIEWFNKSTSDNWSKFVQVASLGSIHNGRLDTATRILENFLKKTSSSHEFGGALFALGLIYANYIWADDIITIITEAITNSTTTAIAKHGGCLGLGLITMGSQNQQYYSMMHDVLDQGDPISGEAAGYAAGLVMIGRGECEELSELYKIARASPHEKIVRSSSFGLAFMMYGLEDKSSTLVEHLLEERDPFLRESAAWVTALAYVGTGSNNGLQRLLHIAISDVNDSVRRAATIGIGFILSRNPERLPGMVKLLAESYNPYVRWGAALALGVGCAGTGNSEAIEILKPLLKDDNQFVLQNAMIAMSLVLQQQSDAAVPYCKEYREYLRNKLKPPAFRLSTKTDIIMFGVSLAYGILNAGGRNIVISCNNLNTENSVPATVGLAMFCNNFYWVPLTLMITLSYHPTAIIGLDDNLKIVDWEFLCWRNKSLFADPPSFNEEAPVVKIDDARVLSITKKEDKAAEATPATTEQKPAEAETKTETTTPPAITTTTEGEAKPEGETTPKAEGDANEDDADCPFFTLNNNCRVTLNQFETLQFDTDFNYKPVADRVIHNGIVMLKRITDE